MRFNGLDLNLLVVFDAVMRERNVTAAARSINLSQPAASAALSRLRHYFKDDLFNMVGREMILTPLGRSLADPTVEILQRVQMTLTTKALFDPRTTKRTFRVVISDFLAIVFFSRVIQRVSEIAPHVTFELLPFDDDPDGLLREGKVDFLLFPEPFLRADYPKTKLFEETLVCVVCRANDMVGEHLNFEDFISMGHVAVQFGKSRKPSIEEWFFLQHSFKRLIEVAVPSFAIVPHMIIGSRRIATMHLRLAQQFARYMPLRIMPIPLPLPTFAEGLQWPVLAEKDQGSLWMRELIVDEAVRMQVCNSSA